MSLKRERGIIICEKCGSRNIGHVKEDLHKCLDCSHTFKLHYGLGFGKEIFSQYEITKDYDNFVRTTYLKSFLSLNQNDVFLDAGCGLGFFTLWAGTIVKQAIGIDIEHWRLRSARIMKEKMKIKNVDFNVANIYDIPYPNDYFDKVFCAEVLEHLVEPSKALRELARVCRKTLVIQVPTNNFFKSVGGKILGITTVDNLDSTRVRERMHAHRSLSHVQMFTTKSILNLIESCGFTGTNLVSIKLIPLHYLTNNSLLVNLEYFCDVVLGTRFPFNMLGAMVIIKSQKNEGPRASA